MKRPLIRTAFIGSLIYLSMMVSLNAQANTIQVEFDPIQNGPLSDYSGFSFEGIDANGDGYLVYDEVSRLTPSFTNLTHPGQNTYEYFAWGVLDINNAMFLNDLFSAWSIPTRPASVTEEAWVQHLFDSNWGPSSNYTIEQMSTMHGPFGVSSLTFDGINAYGVSRYFSINVTSIPEPGSLGLFSFGLIGFMLTRLSTAHRKSISTR